MQRMSDSTKLLLGGAALALLGFFLPFFKDGTPLSRLIDEDSMLLFAMFGLIAMVALCFIPSLYKGNPRSFVTYQVVAWAVNILFVGLFLYNSISEYKKYMEPLDNLGGLLDDALGGLLDDALGDSYRDQSNIQLDIGAFLYIGGNALFAFGLFQIWNSVGGGYAPEVYDAGHAGYAGYPDTMPIDDYPPAPAPIAPPADYQPAQPQVVHAPPKPRKPKTQAWLVDDYSGQTYQLTRGTTSIGRTADNDVCFSDSKVSKHHAKIIEEGGHFRLVDLASTNGTYVNGKMVRQPVMIYPDDTIRFGDRFKVRFVGMKR